MIAVCSTRWSPALATLLLVMSTTLQPTLQASVVSGIVRQMWRPSMGSNSGLTKDRSTLATGRLGHSFSPEASLCLDSFDEQGSDANVTLEMCLMYQAFWLDPIGGKKGKQSNEYGCKQMYCVFYCFNLVGQSFCTADQSAALLKDLRDLLEDNAALCKRWASWLPRMDSLPQITSESVKCSQTLGNEKDVVKCIDEEKEKFLQANATIDQLTELLCKTFFAEEKCNIDGVCKYCPSANKILSLKAQFWTPAEVECTKWSSDKPKFECPANVLAVGPVTRSLPVNTSSSPASVCDSKAAEKGEQCKAEAPKKFPDSENNPEMRCKASYYIVDCALQAICKYCTDSETKEQFNLVRQALDLVREACKQWSSDEPKVECPANVSTVGPVTPFLPGNTSGSPASVCDSKTAENEAECEAEALKRYPDIKNNPEMSCKAAYYIADCSVKAICKYCTDSETKEPFNEERQALDEIREGCKQWWSDEPKLECPSSSTTTSSSNTLMIVGIIIGVIVLLVAIGVAVYCLFFSTDKSAGPSSNAGAGGGSRASSKINSGKAGSTMGSKQQIRASAKQQSRIRAKQSRRASGGAKQQSRIGAKQSSRA